MLHVLSVWGWGLGVCCGSVRISLIFGSLGIGSMKLLLFACYHYVIDLLRSAVDAWMTGRGEAQPFVLLPLFFFYDFLDR